MTPLSLNASYSLMPTLRHLRLAFLKSAYLFLQNPTLKPFGQLRLNQSPIALGLHLLPRGVGADHVLIDVGALTLVRILLSLSRKDMHLGNNEMQISFPITPGDLHTHTHIQTLIGQHHSIL